MTVAIELFIIGVTASFGPCLAHSSAVILPYIACTSRTWQEALRITLIFLFMRLVVYAFLGCLTALFGNLFTKWFHNFDCILYIICGLFISFFGILIIFGKETYQHRLCQLLKKKIIDNSIKGSIILSLIGSILPCLPLLSVLAYISLKAKNLYQGAFYGLAFGAGHFISPLIPLGILAGILPTSLIKSNIIYSFFRRLCGFIIFLIGVNLLAYKL